MNQDDNRTTVQQEQAAHPTTADLAQALNQPTAEQTSPGHRVPDNGPEPLFPRNETDQYRNRWTDIQAAFVDEPRHAVEQADTLVAEVMKTLAQSFANERSRLEGQWSQGDNVSTEDLRQALRRYRSFFDRLLSL